MSLQQQLEALPSLKELLILHDLWAKKSLGQNFLLNPEITDRIAKSARVDDQVILEIGPGPGGLTRSLLRLGAKRVIAIEKDTRCVNLLQSLVEASSNRLKVIQSDALKLNVRKLIDEEKIEGLLHIVANLPYNIGTQLLLNWFKELDLIGSMTLMFQKEVAQRIVAKTGDNAFGRLAIISQYLCEAKILFTLPPEAFTPAPKVSSSVIHLVPKSLNNEEMQLLPYLEKITAHAFGQRRKMLKSSLKLLLDEVTIAQCNINPTTRPEDLSLEAFICLAEKFKSTSKSDIAIP